MRVELLCLDVDGTMTDGSLIYGLNLGNLSLGLHSADFANLERFADFSPVSHPKFAKNHESQTKNPSVVDSALNAESSKDLCEAPENSPASWCKKSGEASSSASADFLLEADKRGSPPKSEKRQLLARRGSGAGGAALLREESSKNGSEENAESSLDSVDSAIISQNGLQCRFCESARNDGVESPQDEFAEILKIFNAKDGLALAYWCKSLKRNAAIITGKKSEILRHRAKELGIKFLFMGVKDKGKVLRGLKKDLALDSAQVACVGDDLNDISMFAESSLNFAPRDCASHLKTLPNITILNTKGGKGAVREALEIILQKEGIYEDFTSFFAR